jgi:4-hydroxybenzoate polyprenyltransferase
LYFASDAGKHYFARGLVGGHGKYKSSHFRREDWARLLVRAGFLDPSVTARVVEYHGNVLSNAAGACRPPGFLEVLARTGLCLGAVGAAAYGVNDIVDAEADRHNPRKGTFLFGSRGALEQLAALRWQIAVAQVPFLLAFLFLIGPRVLLWFATLLLAVALYNARRIGWKGRPPGDVLIQASYLLVFVLSSWLNGAPQLPWPTFVFGALFAMHSHVFGEILDIAPDRLSGRVTTATVIGPVRAKFLIAAFLCVETALVFHFFHDAVIAAFLGAGALWFVLDASCLCKDSAYSPKQMRFFMWAWNAAAIVGMYWNWTKANLTHLH